MMIRHITLVFTFLLLSSITLPAQENVRYWPKQIEVDGIVITIYAPEPEEFENNTLNARAAFSIFDRVHLPVFGAMWFTCKVHTNVKTNEVFFTDIRLENATFPNADGNNIANLQQLIESQATSWHFNSNLQSFYSEVEVLRTNDEFNEELSNIPPKIIYAKQPTVLVYIDGDVKLGNIGGSELYQFVVNTPHFIVRSSSDRQFYLKAGPWWFVTSDVYGSWQAIETPPNQIARLAEKAVEVDPNRTGDKSQPWGKQPKLIVTKEPAELIQTNGEPEIKQIYENLFSITNSDDEIIFDSRTDHYYILISGRWYRSKNLERGTWTFVPPGSMPEVFTKIPADSPFSHVRLSIQGTPEALTAALNNGIPQTAVVDRMKTKMFVEYDGDPHFQEIKGTSLKYAINTGGSVIETDQGQYYAVDQAVWFNAESPNGPWTVADHFPLEVRRIPPSCPVFNMKFVNIYDADNEVVFVGYTAGYLGAFLYKGVVYYGTGYKYKSWFGDKYIPRPNTYGFGAKKKTSKASPNVQFYAASGMGGPMMGMGFAGYPYGYGYGMGFGYGGYYGYGMWNQMAYNQYYYSGQKIMIDHDVMEKKPIDLVNLYNNRAEGIVITETARKNDPMKPIILKDRQAVPQELYVDDDGILYRQDDQGQWYEQTASGWRQTAKTVKN